MTTRPDAGYNEPYPENEGMEPVIFEVEDYEQQWTASGKVLRVTRNDVAIGILRVKGEGEYEWLKERITGIYEPGD